MLIIQVMIIFAPAPKPHLEDMKQVLQVNTGSITCMTKLGQSRHSFMSNRDIDIESYPRKI